MHVLVAKQEIIISWEITKDDKNTLTEIARLPFYSLLKPTDMNEIDQINEVLAALVDPEIRKVADLSCAHEEDEIVLLVNTMTAALELYDLTAGEIRDLEPIATARIALPEQIGGAL